MILDIVTHPDDRLRKKSKIIEKQDIQTKKFQGFIVDLIDTMHEKDGIGLASPQVGISQRVVIINTKDGALALINPEIVKKSWTQETEEEGCLSVPNVFGLVKRPKSIKVKALDKDGQPMEFAAKGLFARVIQHELDHLDGVLFIDKMKK
jgi:peptide deformylase